MIDCDGEHEENEENEENKATKIYFVATSDGDFMRWIQVKETPEEVIELIARNYRIIIDTDKIIEKTKEGHN